MISPTTLFGEIVKFKKGKEISQQDLQLCTNEDNVMILGLGSIKLYLLVITRLLKLQINF